jgi:hypothetical protein
MPDNHDKTRLFSPDAPTLIAQDVRANEPTLVDGRSRTDEETLLNERSRADEVTLIDERARADAETLVDEKTLLFNDAPTWVDFDKTLILNPQDINTQGRPSILTQALVGMWRGAQSLYDTGVEAVDEALAFALFEIPSAPDLSSSRFPEFAALTKAQRLAYMGGRMSQFLAALHALGIHTAVSLRYWFQPQADGGRIRLFLLGRCLGYGVAEAERSLRAFRETVQRSFPREYPLIDLPELDLNSETGRKVFALEGVQSIAELLKPEQNLAAWHPAYCGFSYYYTPRFFEPSANSMVEFCHALTREAHGREALVDICLLPTRSLTDPERTLLGHWKQECDKWGKGFAYTEPGGLYSTPRRYHFDPDPHAPEAGRIYEQNIQRYGAGRRYFLYAIRALWDAPEPPYEILSVLASFALKPGNKPQPVVLDAYHPAFARAVNAIRYCYVSPAVCRQDIWSHDGRPEALRRLHRMVDIDEIAGFFRLPVAGREGCPGVPLC